MLTRRRNRILRTIGVDPDDVSEEGGTPEELKALIAESYTGGKLDPGEAGHARRASSTCTSRRRAR